MVDITLGALIGVSVIGGSIVLFPTIKNALGYAPYLYTNARVNAREAWLLTEKEYEELALASSLKEAFASLDTSVYAQDVEKSKGYSQFAQHLQEKLCETYEWLGQVASRKTDTIIKEMYGKFEINQIKNFLTNFDPETDMTHVRAEIREGLKDAKTLATALPILQTHFDSLASVKTDDVQIVINALDRQFLEDMYDIILRVENEDAAPYKDLWQHYIDIANLRAAMRNIKRKTEFPLLQGGHFSAEDLEKCNEIEQLLETFKKHYQEMNTVEDLSEAIIYKHLRKTAAHLATKYYLKSGTLVSYLVLIELEIRNLNIILKLKQKEIEPNKIKELIA